MWCSGRGGTCTAGGLRFESRRPRTHEIHAKMSEMGERWLVGASIDKKNSIYLGKNSHFFGFNFAECRALGKGFAECPIKDTWQSWLCRHCFWRVLFTECYTRRTICRVFYVFCRMFRALGKLKGSGSDLNLIRKPTY